MTAETEPIEAALVTYDSDKSGLVVGADIADLTDEEFDRRLARLTAREKRIRRIQQAAMVKGADYGEIPNVDRPTLLKGGAEKLTNMNGLVAQIDVQEIVGDGITTPTIRYNATCLLRVGDFEGPIVGKGGGIASSWETKYRYLSQRSQLVCPDCGRSGVVKTRRNVYWHPSDAQPDGGCDANFSLDDERIKSQKVTLEKIDDPNPWDKANTLFKMAEKRAHVDAVLRSTGTSGLFSQDVEDMSPDDRDRPSAGHTPDVNGARSAPATEWSIGRFRYHLGKAKPPVKEDFVYEVMSNIDWAAGRRLEDLNATEFEELWAIVEARNAQEVSGEPEVAS